MTLFPGKAVYVTATLPYFLLLALTGRALTLEGADDGLRYFFHPDWSILLRSEVNACLHLIRNSIHFICIFYCFVGK